MLASLLLAAAHASDIWILWVILALCAGGAAIYLAIHNQIVAAIVCLIIAVVLVVIAL